ncbi:MAG: polyphenol oxidase family protein [Acidobacteria bacterium]|nr:polyphenol oxidase family protein [Acidobacteriota bacterium]
MAQRRALALDNGSTLHIVTTERSDGDFGINAEPKALDERRRSHCDLSWSVPIQVHGRAVIEVAGAASNGAEGDGLVTADLDRPLAIQTADCAPVVLYGPGSWFAVAHAGWRGLEAGVVEATVARLQQCGGVVDAAWVGPCIGAECYTFSEPDLARLTTRFGPAIVACNAEGEPSFDLRAAIAVTMGRLGVERVEISDACTACRRDLFSHRARGEAQRMATVAWTER